MLKKQFKNTLELNSPDNKTQKSTVKIGHAGTLDPLATGLLIICTGKYTKEIEEFQMQEKEYVGTICFGSTTPSFDLEQPIDAVYPFEHITLKAIQEAIKQFTGTFEQIPPAYSAIKINGRRAYKLARSGKTPELKAKTISVSVFEITNLQLPFADFKIVCSKGTYIRSLANDLGKALNSGAHLTKLCRTRIGTFKLEQAMEIEQMQTVLQHHL